MGGVADDVLFARALLSRVAEPASIPLWGFVRDVGPVEAAARILARTAPSAIVAATAGRLPDADPWADIEAGSRHGVRLVVPEGDEWPHFAFAALEMTGLARLDTYRRGTKTHAEHGEPMPPLALWVQGHGDLAAVGTRSVGIVGARAATAYGEGVAADLAYGLARRGFAVISGGAYGIDAAAHRAALAAGGQTVLVSAGGLDRPYPPTSARLFEHAAESGLVVSESPPGAAPRRRRFLTRNRLIAALATGSIVVEAAKRSGAMNTAGHCTRLGRPLMAVPGPVTSAMSAGCHALLARTEDRADLVTGVDDVLLLIGGASDLPPECRAGSGDTGDIRTRLDGVDERARQVYDGFPSRRPVRPDELARASGLSPLEVIRALPVLELAGLVEAGAEGYRLIRPSRSRSPTA